MTSKQKAIGIVALLAVVAMGVFAWPKVRAAVYGLPPEKVEGETDSGRLSPFAKPTPNGEGSLFTEQERLALARQIGITPEQEKKIDVILKGDSPPKDFQERLNRLYKAESVLTPMQKLKARALVPGKIAARFEKRRQNAKKNLPPDEFAAYDRKYQAERQKILKTVPDGIVVPTPVP